MDFIQVVSAEPNLNRRLRIAIIQLFDTYLRITEIICILLCKLVYQIFGGFVSYGVNNKLRIVGAAQLRGVRCLETGRRTAVESGNVDNSLVVLHHIAQAVGYFCCLFDGCSLRKIQLYGKLIAFCARH